MFGLVIKGLDWDSKTSVPIPPQLAAIHCLSSQGTSRKTGLKWEGKVSKPQRCTHYSVTNQCLFRSLCTAFHRLLQLHLRPFTLATWARRKHKNTSNRNIHRWANQSISEWCHFCIHQPALSHCHINLLFRFKWQPSKCHQRRCEACNSPGSLHHAGY